MRHLRFIALAATVALTAAGVGPLTPADAGVTASDHGGQSPESVTAHDKQIDVRLRTAARRLPVAVEVRAGYDRDKFRLWVDANGDCQDTRDEVLDAESRVSVSGCDITRGKWFSYYDGRTWRNSADVDIDHLVPLAEAWDSGARRWNPNTRQRYANDLGDRRTLVAVTDNVNQSKSDQDIAEWLPHRSRCLYLQEWVAVKTRWSLTTNRGEKRTMRRLASGCRNVMLHVRKATIGLGGGGGGGGGPQPIGRMRIAKVVYDPPGTDTENAETITLINRGAKAQLKGFQLRDEADASYRLPAYRIGCSHNVVIHSGNGANKRGHLYAGWGSTWNNTGDTARLLKPAGAVIDACTWGDGSGTVTC